MTTKEAATKAGVTETLVKRWLKRGDVLGTKTGRSWDVDAESLRVFLGKPRLRGTPRWRDRAKAALDDATAEDIHSPGAGDPPPVE